MAALTPFFTSQDELSKLITEYFVHIQATLQSPRKAAKISTGKIPAKKTGDSGPEPPTITGLALFLGFNSRREYETYERKRKYAPALKRGRLLIEAAYEKKLHQQPASGAIFALKSMGWNEHPEVKTIKRPGSKNMKVEIVEAGPAMADNEKEVAL